MKKEIKRIVSVILTLMMLMSTGAMCISASAAETFEEYLPDGYQGFAYQVVDGEATITGLNLVGDAVIPETLGGYPVTGIEEKALQEQGITSIFIPASIEDIGIPSGGYRSVFYGCLFLEEITVDENNPNYSSVDGVLFSKDKTKLYQYPLAVEAESYAVPDGVVAIYPGAFENAYNLKKVTFPETLKYIEREAFRYCVNLEGAHIPASVIYMTHPFTDCPRLEYITVDDDNPRYSDIDGVLYNKAQTTIVRYPSAREDESYTLPDTVTIIGDGLDTNNQRALHMCPNLKELTISPDMEMPEWTTGYDFFMMDGIQAIRTPDDCENFVADENGVLYTKDMSNLVYYPKASLMTSYTIPEGVYIGDEISVMYINNLLSLVLPAGFSQADYFYSNDYRYIKSKLSDIYYCGSEEQWNEIYGEERPENITIHFDHKDGDHVHDYEIEVTKEATCAEKGNEKYTCSCGKILNFETEKDHEFFEMNHKVFIEPTCTEIGYDVFFCDVCGIPETELIMLVLPLGHSFTVTATPSTATAAGELAYDCKNCDHSETAEIPAGDKYIIYDVNGKMSAAVYTPGEAIEAPEAPEKDGLEFIGWKKADGETVELNTMPDENLELTPAFGMADSTSKVTAVFDEDCFEAGTDVTLVVQKFSGDRVPGGIYYKEDLYNNIAIYDICFKVGEDEVQPKDGKSVEISIPVPEGCESFTEFYIIHRHNGRKYDEFTVAVKNGRITFNASKFSEFEVYVKSGTQVKSLPSKLNYNYKDALDLSGIAFEVTDANGNKTTVTDTSKMTVKGYDAKKIGTQKVTVECNGVTAEFNVTVSYSWWQMIIRILLLGFLWY